MNAVLSRPWVPAQGLRLAEPECCRKGGHHDCFCKRGSFHRAYAKPKAQRTPDLKGFRLLDCLLSIVPYGDAEYRATPGAGEFAVVDVVTLEKAFFDMPPECTPDMVAGMVASTFNSTAYRVGDKLWFV